MNKNLRHSRNGGFFFIPLIFSLGGGIVGGAIGGGAIGGIGISAMFGMTGTQIGGMLGMMAGSLLGNMLFPQENETPWPELNEYPIQKSTNGPPIQVVLGTRLVSGNVTWEGDVTPYSIRHSAGGKGGGSMGKGGEAEGTGYLQSFLIDIGEGPMSVLKIYANNVQIYPAAAGYVAPDFTVFEGINNSGIPDLTGEDYGQWPHNCCVFFSNYDLGGYQTKPNLTFEVSTEPFAEYFVGIDGIATSHHVAKVTNESELNTDWGDSGYWDGGQVGGVCYTGLRLPDGRILVSHNYATVTMVNTDGTTDTSWGTNGSYTHPNTREIKKILLDADGNFHLFNSGSSSDYRYIKLSSSGGFLAGISGAYQSIEFTNAIWADDDKTRIIGIGAMTTVRDYGPPDSGYKSANIMAIDPDSGVRDTDWDGNISLGGYAFFESPATFYHIARLSDDTLILMQNASDTLIAIESDGSAVNTSWGTSGFVSCGTISINPEIPKLAQINDDIYVLTNDTIEAVTYNIITRIDRDGTVVDSTNIAASYGHYHCIAAFGNKLYLGTKTTSPAQHTVEQWSRTLEYEAGFDISDANLIYFILPDYLVGKDMNFATMCREVLTNAQWGADLGSVKADPINETTFAAAEYYCDEQGLLGSIVIDEQRSWRDWLDYICSHFGGYWYESGGQICLGVYRDTEPVASLDEANGDFMIEDGDNPPPPIQIEEREYAETFNRIKVTFTDRDNDYAQGGPVVANDETDQRISGQIREKTYDLCGICDIDLAQRMAYRFLIDGMYRFKIFKYPVPYKWMLLEDGDVINISGRPNIVNEKVRIYQRAEEQRGRGIDTIAIEDISHLYPTISFTAQGSTRLAVAQISLADGTVNFREDTVTNQLYLSIAPGGSQTNGWYIYRSYDDATYELIGRCGIAGLTGGDANSDGTISGSLPAHGSTTWAPDESVLVDIGTLTDLHTDITEAQFWGDLRLAKIGDEIIAFRDAVETATAGIWLISCLRRGCFGTEASAHTAGEAFCTLDSDFLYRFNESDIGRTLYFKAVTFYGDISQNISSVSSFNVTIQGYYKRSGAASLLRLTSDENDGGSGEYSGSSFTLYWDNPEQDSPWDVLEDGEPLDDTIEDSRLNSITLKFEQTDGTAIGQRDISVATSETITKATDLGGFDDAVIRVIPRIVAGSRLENSIQVTAV